MTRSPIELFWTAKNDHSDENNLDDEDDDYNDDCDGQTVKPADELQIRVG